MRITIVYAQGMSSAPSSLCFPCSYTFSFFFSLYLPFYYHSMHIRTIPIRGDKILLLTTKDQSKWCFPKGGWETDETLEEAARRETREEAGVCSPSSLSVGCATNDLALCWLILHGFLILIPFLVGRWPNHRLLRPKGPHRPQLQAKHLGVVLAEGGHGLRRLPWCQL